MSGKSGKQKNLRSVERVTVTRVVALEGDGTQENPYQEVTSYFADDGTLLGSNYLDIGEQGRRRG